MPAGRTVSYGARYVTPGPERLATIGIGYADGLPWRLAGGSVIVRGRRAPIRGAVCMDVTVVDVSGIPDVGPGDPVTVLGRDGNEEITLGEIADEGGTIEYEVLTGLGRRLPRIYRGDGEGIAGGSDVG